MELLKITFENNSNIVIYCSPWVWGLVVVSVLIYILYVCFFKNKLSRSEVEVNEIELGIGKNKIKIKPNYQTIQIAYNLWVELSTRKLGLPVDAENDVIIEIYDSWYAFFGVARELIKKIPAQKAQNKDTKELIALSSKILNVAIRPHLTKWQARYREWYKRKNANIKVVDTSPQVIQKQYICTDKSYCYDVLMKELQDVNKKIIEYKKILECIVFGEELKGL